MDKKPRRSGQIHSQQLKELGIFNSDSHCSCTHKLLFTGHPAHARHGFLPDALFRRRVRLHTADGDELPESTTMRLLMGFLPRRRISSQDVCGSDGGRFNPVATFLSLLRVQLQESPPSSFMFHFGPQSSNFICFPYFWYITFDFSQLGPPIAID